MLKIKLSRIGKKNKPMYRLIISEQSKDPYGNSLEILGSYNPHTKELQAKQDRIRYWLSKGAQMTPTINNLLVGQKVIEGNKVKASKANSKKKQTAEPTEAKPAEAKEEQSTQPTEVKEDVPTQVEESKEETKTAEPEKTEEPAKDEEKKEETA